MRRDRSLAVRDPIERLYAKSETCFSSPVSPPPSSPLFRRRPAMRFSLAETMCDPAQYVPLAQAAEEVGFHAYTLPDSIAYPEVSDSKYPYTPDGSREFLENKPFIDPLCL